MQELTPLMISCRSYCCVRYGQWLYMVWCMDLSLHLHRQPPPLHVPVPYLTVSHFLLWEKWLGKELTPVGAETSTPWWNQERKSWGSGFQVLKPSAAVQDHLALRLQRKVEGLSLPLWESFIQHLPHTSASCMLQNHKSRQFHDNRHRDFNVERKVWRIWALMR